MSTIYVVLNEHAVVVTLLWFPLPLFEEFANYVKPTISAFPFMDF
ncbi:hypothetical protein ACBP46_01030 [Paenalcaligenes hominis]